MWRWIFLCLLVANVFPALLSGNSETPARSAPSSRLQEPLPYGVESIALLGEEWATGAEEPQEDTEAVNLLPQRREMRCFLIGPLGSMATTEKYAEVLERAGLEIGRHWREVTVGSDYWVYLPKLPSSRAITRTLRELKASDIDGFIFSEGELEGAIAVAVYTNRPAAEAEKVDLVELGYEARVHQMDRLAREYWLMSEAVPRPGLMVELMNSGDVTEIPQKISRTDCKTVASAMHFQ